MLAAGSAVQAFLDDEDGADATEYALVMSFVALAIVLAVASVGTGINNVYNSLASGVGHMLGG